jgi:CRP-like cAMP-binding protein
VYFPLTAGISLLTPLEGGAVAETALVGNDGMVGISLFLGEAYAAHRTQVQVPGAALRLGATAFRAALDSEATLRGLLGRYTRVRLIQLARSAACNARHPLDKRCARWLLETQDRVGMTAFPATHELLATMLGVQRTSVTLAAGTLQGAGLIRYHRGRVTIVDRERLEGMACTCYGAIAGVFETSLAPHGRGQ